MSATSRATTRPGARRDAGTGATLWFTGLPSAGKSTIAHALAEQLRAEGRRVRHAARVGERGGGRRAHRWIPHSVLPVPAQRPARGSSPGATGLVHGAQPIEG